MTVPAVTAAEHRRGLAMAATTFALWGFFPLYWTLMGPSRPLELIGQRICWAVVVLGVVVLLRRGLPAVRLLLRDRRSMAWAFAAAMLININAGVYIWAVTHEHVVETSLGFFVNPLVTVLLGVVILHERLALAQWLAVGVAVTAVLILTVDYGRPPWLGLAMALTYGSYGLCKKGVRGTPIAGMTIEMLLAAPLGAGFLVHLGTSGQLTFASHGPGHALLLASTGVISVAPFVLFTAAAPLVPLTEIGLLQFLTPIGQFVLGLWVFGEPMPTTRWIGFALIWAALIILTWQALRPRTVAVPAVAD